MIRWRRWLQQNIHVWLYVYSLLSTTMTVVGPTGTPHRTNELWTGGSMVLLQKNHELQTLPSTLFSQLEEVSNKLTNDCSYRIKVTKDDTIVIRLTGKTGEPPLVDLIETLFQQPLFANKDSVSWKLYEESNNKLSVFRSGHFGRQPSKTLSPTAHDALICLHHSLIASVGNSSNSINVHHLLRTRQCLNGFTRRQQLEAGEWLLINEKRQAIYVIGINRTIVLAEF